MKAMKNTMKCLVAVFVMAMAFVMTGITAEAAVTGLAQIGADTTAVKVQYNTVSGQKYYGYEVATDAAFANVVKKNYDITTATSDYIYVSGLSEGSTYYVRIGHGTSSSACYANWSAPLEVITAPGSVTVSFIDATDNTATISFSSNGANLYRIFDSAGNLIGQTNTTSYAITMNNEMDNYYKVQPCRMNSAGTSIATNYDRGVYVNLLTTKISKDNFGITSVLDAINELKVAALFSGSGFEVEFTNVGGKKYSKTASATKSYAYTGSDTMYFPYKQGRYLKYRVRAYVQTDAGIKYGEWSDYRAFCELDVKLRYTRQYGKITVKWNKASGTGKIKVAISTKEKKGYKSFKTLKGSAKSVTINKIGKKKLSGNKKYYIKLTPMVKIGKKYVNSDYIMIYSAKTR